MIRPGCHVYVGADESWRYAAPLVDRAAELRFVRVAGPNEVLRTVQRIAHTGAVDDGPTADSTDPAIDSETDPALVAEVLAAFDDQGVLASADEPATTRALDGPVHVSGDSPIAHVVTQVLGSDLELTSGVVDEDVVRRSAVVVSVAGWLPDAHWRQVDAWCRRYETAWHMTYLEAADIVVGPMFLPGRTASYLDTRGRRLAASGTAGELRAFWAYLDGPDPKPPVPWPSPAGAAVVGGLVANDVVAFLRNEPVPSDSHQLVVDLANATIERHPVLPLPPVG